ncbi:MAG: bacteriohemerythrin [Geothrix sp.]|nr:bacteriohemerythrin [Geothrix sp.]
MTEILWTPALETGDPRIDEQHQALIQAFNDLATALAGNRGWEANGKTLRFLVSYTIQHFQMEERLMEEAKYPGASRHRQLHHELVVKVSGLLQAYTQGSANLSPEVLGFLEGWLMEHILGEDRRLAEFLRERSVP